MDGHMRVNTSLCADSFIDMSPHLLKLFFQTLYCYCVTQRSRFLEWVKREETRAYLPINVGKCVYALLHLHLGRILQYE
ncbi:hypothetical protein POVWA2_030280 [Plasmodium ovale wallikeri]|uniref:Uncharacterized protein n=1 Tax=Plasmodium ovale wallikeri TaxID=864142 RepID=A0A1A8YXA3_PLAOA|nr:hypothetical protein POVWA1_030680 [Plasmodium ovale wallikeri]SBT36446.1 hypothetical protein POVWA2_030280 [Plasmodium ovale wallikeri]